jgi:putative flavoprotein involved in K+ transport
MHYPVIIVGGGQAGLSTSYCLQENGIDHVLFEKNRIAEAWRSERWDTFCLVTPNWQCQLPGFSYTGAYGGDNPNGFMEQEEIVAFVEAYAASFDPPVREGVTVTRVAPGDAGFTVETDTGTHTADQVVIAVGTYHRPKIPPIADDIAPAITQIHSRDYTCPEDLPDGDVLVVGSGQSGAQIAEDLHWAGRTVHLSVGSAPRAPRTYRGRDVVAWLDDMGYYDLPVHEHPEGEAVRHKTNHYLSGRNGGHTIDLRQLSLEGMHLYGRLDAADGTEFSFLPTLKANLDAADASAASIKERIDAYIEANDLDAPTEPPYVPPWEPDEEPTHLDGAAHDVRTVLWATGYGFDFHWIDAPVFDADGYPQYERGVTDVDGLYFVGLAWLYTWGSGRFGGVGRDARYIVERICEQQAAGAPVA